MEKALGQNTEKLKKIRWLSLGGSGFSMSGAHAATFRAGYALGRCSEKEAIAIVHRAAESGVNLIDTAPLYGFGCSEKIIGTALNMPVSYELKQALDNVMLSTKLGIFWDDDYRVFINNSPARLKKQFEKSLTQLGREHIEFCSLHWPDTWTDVREAVYVLDSFKERKNISAIGLSNTDAGTLKKAQEMAPIDFVQNQFNVFDAATGNSLDYFVPGQMLMASSSLAQGTLIRGLSSRVDYDRNDIRSEKRHYKKIQQAFNEKLFHRILGYCSDREITMLEFCLAYYYQYAPSHTQLFGLHSLAQWQSLVQAVHKVQSGVVAIEPQDLPSLGLRKFSRHFSSLTRNDL